MSARQIARLRALVEEKIRQENAATAESDSEEEYFEEKPHTSFSVIFKTEFSQ